jgi:hypothetical protein
MKSTLPWILVLLLIAGGSLLFSANQRQAAEIARLQPSPANDGKGNSSNPDVATPATATDSAQVGQLRKDHEELLRLRNDVRQLREENRRLTSDLQKAQQSAATHQQQLEAGMAEVQQLKAQTAQAEKSHQVMLCVNNLRQIEAAKLQWSVENNRPAGVVPTQADLMAYFPNKAFPTCPAGGLYNLNPVGQPPTCTVPGHVLPK